ncbi:hypothetical protein BJ322DRAFT_742892 [Thelephora terrestris]|uniref:Uncharacterized protein n=1 Tax=Thelephora terrestris TaxID=56493 RepID=A0A9P6L6Q6_9AGAM|nr:hypothetical protein BJ322DRAFT_742892 [Thelephora terrestris]
MAWRATSEAFRTVSLIGFPWVYPVVSFLLALVRVVNGEEPREFRMLHTSYRRLLPIERVGPTSDTGKRCHGFRRKSIKSPNDVEERPGSTCTHRDSPTPCRTNLSPFEAIMTSDNSTYRHWEAVLLAICGVTQRLLPAELILEALDHRRDGARTLGTMSSRISVLPECCEHKIVGYLTLGETGWWDSVDFVFIRPDACIFVRVRSCIRTMALTIDK